MSFSESAATACLMVGHWVLIHWVPTGMSFAKPAMLRRHIEALLTEEWYTRLAALREFERRAAAADDEADAADLPIPRAAAGRDEK